MENDICYIIKTHPHLLNLYQKEDLRYIKSIYFDHLRHKQIIKNDFSFLQFVAKLHEMGFKPHKYSIIRYDTKKPFTETNIRLKPTCGLQTKLQTMAKIVHENKRVSLKINDKAYQINLKHPNRKYERRIYIKQ